MLIQDDTWAWALSAICCPRMSSASIDVLLGVLEGSICGCSPQRVWRNYWPLVSVILVCSHRHYLFIQHPVRNFRSSYELCFKKTKINKGNFRKQRLRKKLGETLKFFLIYFARIFSDFPTFSLWFPVYSICHIVLPKWNFRFWSEDDFLLLNLLTFSLRLSPLFSFIFLFDLGRCLSVCGTAVCGFTCTSNRVILKQASGYLSWFLDHSICLFFPFVSFDSWDHSQVMSFLEVNVIKIEHESIYVLPYFFCSLLHMPVSWHWMRFDLPVLFALQFSSS